MNNIPCDMIPVKRLVYKDPKKDKDPKASEERFEAICRFVDILTPQEIKGLTKFYHETWTVGEFTAYCNVEGTELVGNDLISYTTVKKPNYNYNNISTAMKVHLSFRYKFQKFAYVLISLAPTT